MAETTRETVIRYLEDAIAAERSFEAQLRAFASESDDDDDVRLLFSKHAEETHLQYERLTLRLTELGGSPSTGKSIAAHVFGLAPKSAQIALIAEERIVQNLMAAYTIEAAECAMYEALANVAHAAGDPATESLARSIQAEEHATGNKLWACIPTRSIIAYNMLTLDEIDPSVETKIGEGSWAT